jgi:hypothetical protein
LHAFRRFVIAHDAGEIIAAMEMRQEAQERHVDLRGTPFSYPDLSSLFDRDRHRDPDRNWIGLK